MTAPSQETIEREKDKLFLTEAELIRRLGIPETILRARLPELETKYKFPKPDPLFGHRRYWPAVQEWFVNYYRLEGHRL